MKHKKHKHRKSFAKWGKEQPIPCPSLETLVATAQTPAISRCLGAFGFAMRRHGYLI